MSLRAGPSVWAASAIAIGLTALAVWYIGGASWSADLGTIIQEAQRDLHGRLATAIRAVQDNRALALWNLVVLGFLYGIFHAAGPGHGKFVISTYVATTESGVRRGITLTLASSFLQGLTAIVVVEGAVRVLGLALRDARATACSRWSGRGSRPPPRSAFGIGCAACRIMAMLMIATMRRTARMAMATNMDISIRTSIAPMRRACLRP
jgi:ABC-type nickel/cobalt efflux system permease component RcnA